jgi:hypothetical protein
MRDFINARMNKDNFWNVMFLALTSLVIFIAQLLMDIIPAGFLLLFAAIILSPYCITRFNTVKYENNEFTSSTTNRKLGKYAPKYLGFLIWCAIPFSAFWILLLHSKAPYLDENMALYNAIFWLVPTIYFILKNLPISMIFNKKSWTENGTASYSTMNSDNNFSSNAFDDSTRTGMNYDYLPNNIWHSSYLDRHRK